MRYPPVQNATFVLLLAIATIGFFWVVWGFLMPVFWAAVAVLLFAPVHRRWLRLVRGRASIAALLSVITVVLVGLLPIAFVTVSVVREALGIYAQVSEGGIEELGPVEWLGTQAPRINTLLGDVGFDLAEVKSRLSSMVVTVSRSVAGWGLDFGRNLARFIALAFVMLYVAFFFFRDGKGITARVVRAIPLGKGREQELIERFAIVVRGTVKGTVVIGLIQGTLGGLAFWVLGIGAPILWGAIMVVLSILPAVGSGLVWLPAAIILIASGSWVKGVILILFGALVIGLVDNFLRPLLVGRDTRMPDYLILITTLGGLSVFGISGFVLGPVIAALCLVLWQMLESEIEGRTSRPPEPEV